MDTDDNIIEGVVDAITEVSDKHDADLIFYSGTIEAPQDSELIEQAAKLRTKKNVMLWLTTNGGDPDSAYKIARCLQRVYQGGQFVLFVSTYCKSAGTLLALGADELVMCDAAELGPLDIQLSKPDELMERTSGLTPTQAIGTLRDQAFEAFEQDFLQLLMRSGSQITTRTALDISTKLVVGLFEPIFAQIDPMRLGEIQRANQIAKEYGRRLKRGNVKDDCVDRLIEDYPSHGFVIDRDEAKELFKRVRSPIECEEKLAQELRPLMQSDGHGRILFLNEFKKLSNAQKVSDDATPEKNDGQTETGTDAASC